MTAEDASADTPGGIRPTVDVLALTNQERWHELTRFMYLEGGRFYLSGIKESAGIAAGDTHITLDQLKALHHGLGRIVEGLDRPAREGPSMSHLVGLATCNVADLAADAGVDADALQRHLDGDGPLSQIAFQRVFDKMVGAKATAATSVIVTCPSWCTTNHLGDDKPIEHDGPRWPTVEGVSGKSWANVGICTDREHGVVVWLDADYGPNLTPQRARELAIHLLEAAAWVKDHRDD